MSASERPTVLQQALELIRRRELRVLGPLPRQRRRRPAVGDQQMTLVKSSNETITKADVQIGYLHRGFEKMCERGNWTQVFPYVDRANYVSPMLNNVGSRRRRRLERTPAAG